VRRFFADTTPLRAPDFRRLWVAGIVTVIGANLTIFAVPVQLYALTQNSAYVGLSGLFALVPLIVFGLWGGVWADAMDRRLLLIIASIGLALASVLLWVMVAGGPRLADAAHGATAAVVGTTVAAAGGGALVVIGMVACTVLVPAFIRYRVGGDGNGANDDKVWRGGPSVGGCHFSQRPLTLPG
jgi:MFS family permease